MNVIGLDVGPANTAYAALDWRASRAHWLDGDMVAPDLALIGWRELFDHLRADLIAVEWPEQGKRQAMGNILKAREIATRIESAAAVSDLPFLKINALTWRSNVLGRTRKTEQETIDQICARVLTPQIVRMPARMKNHIRDAAGVALFAVRHAGARRTG